VIFVNDSKICLQVAFLCYRWV